MYIVSKVILTTKQVELMRIKKLVVIALDQKNEVFVGHIASICRNLNIYLFYRV